VLATLQPIRIRRKRATAQPEQADSLSPSWHHLSIDQAIGLAIAKKICATAEGHTMAQYSVIG
jgi:hypothetical protein